MKRLTTFAATLLCLVAFACKPADNANTPANAPAGEHVRLRDACSEDITKFCNGQTGKAMRQCLKQNLYQVSDTCKSAWKERRQRIKAKKAAAAQNGAMSGQTTTTTPANQQATKPATTPGTPDKDDDDDDQE